jgi:plasmid stabilization system protein ParE
MTVKWTKRAESSYRSILDYITSEFGSQTAKVFKQKTIDFLGLLAKFPEVGSLEIKEKNIRGFQMTKPPEYFIGSKATSLSF